MKRVQVGHGIAMAVFAAGPLLMLVVSVATLIFDTPSSDDFWIQATGMLTLSLIAVPLGAIWSLIPNLVGGLAMAWLGVHYPSTRRRRVWALAGALLVMLTLAPIAGFEKTHAAVYALFALTGALSALIVHYGTRWFDDASP